MSDAALTQQGPAQPDQHQAQQPAHDIGGIGIAERMQWRREEGIGHLRQHRRFDRGAIDDEPLVGDDSGRQQHVIVEFVDLAGRHDGRQEIQSGGDGGDGECAPGNRRTIAVIAGRPAEDPSRGATGERAAPERDQGEGRCGLGHRHDLDGEADRLNAQQHGCDLAERRREARAKQLQQQQAETHAGCKRDCPEKEHHGGRVGVHGEE